jgi:hypothetical protein
MHRRVFLLLLSLTAWATAQPTDEDQTIRAIRQSLSQHEYEFSKQGEVFLLNETRPAAFFRLGELHGENEIPALLRDLWPEMWQQNYRHIAAELSPWAANQLHWLLPAASRLRSRCGRSRPLCSCSR